MEPISAITSMGKLLFDILKEIANALGKRKKEKGDIAGMGSAIRLYGSSIALTNYFQRLQQIHSKTAEQLTKEDMQLVVVCVDELKFFAQNLNALNLHVIEIYYPDLARELRWAMHFDIALLEYFDRVLVPAMDLDPNKMEKVAKLFIEQMSYDYHWKFENDLAFHVFFLFSSLTRSHEPDTALAASGRYIEVRDSFLQITDTLMRCRELIGQVIRDTWDLEEVLKAKVHK